MVVNMLKALCVGDVHGLWGPGDEAAVRALAPQLIFFVGDYGDEAVDVVRRISSFAHRLESSGSCRVVAVLGNHEAIRHALDPELNTGTVEEQIRLLAPFNPSCAPRCVSVKNTSDADDSGEDVFVLGGRQFSFGGDDFGRFAHIYERYSGVKSMQESITRLHVDVHSVPPASPVVFLSHNGPSGLGDTPDAICGNDYELVVDDRGDRGDPDLRAAIEKARSIGHRVPLVVFGHFHNRLARHQGFRNMLAVEEDGDSGNKTVFVNSAFVPRHRVGQGERLHHFMQILLRGADSDVTSVEEIWVNVHGEIQKRRTHYGTVPGCPTVVVL